MTASRGKFTGYRQTSAKGSRGEYSLGQRNAEEVYGQLKVRRENILTRAREIAELTIPSLFPPDGYQEGDKLYVPYQDIGARCINTLASRIVLTMLPPNRAPFRHQVPDTAIEALKKDAKQMGVTAEDLKSKIDLGLSKREQAAKSSMETTPLRTVLTEAVKQLLVGGGVLYRHQDLDAPQIHSMQQYVVKRNAKGQPLLVILEEQVAYVDLDDDVKAAVEEAGEGDKSQGTAKDEWDRTVPIYSVMRKDGDWWYSWQECSGGYVIPGTEGRDPIHAPPMWPIWMIPMYGHNWGRAYADEYYSGLLSAENLSKAIQEGSIAAAWTLFFTKPGSRTRPKQLKEARNLDILVGSAEDITTLRLEKSADFQVAENMLMSVEKRLGYAFLLNSAVQRDGERVTAEEIRLLARELDQAMGGVYSSIAEGFQRVVVRRYLHLMEREDKNFPKLPETANVGISIVTGIDSLGRSYDDQLLDELIGETAQSLGPEVVAKHINADEYFRRKAAAKAINPEGLIRTAEQISQLEQQAQMQSMQQQVLPGAAQEGVKGIVKDLLQQRQAQLDGQAEATPPTPTSGARRS